MGRLLSASTLNSENQAAALYASRLTIGKYIVDREDEARVRIEMILMDLKKTNAFLAKLKAKVGRLRVGYERQTYEGLVNLLCTRLREATIRLQKQRVKMNGFIGGFSTVPKKPSDPHSLCVFFFFFFFGLNTSIC